MCVEFKHHVEKTDGDGVRDDDRQRQIEEIIRMRDGFRPGEEGEEEPEEDLQNAGIEEAP